MTYSDQSAPQEIQIFKTDDTMLGRTKEPKNISCHGLQNGNSIFMTHGYMGGGILSS